MDGREIKAEVIISDFEKAAINAVDKVFDLDYGGCYFHLKKSFLKKAGKLGLKKMLGEYPA